MMFTIKVKVAIMAQLNFNNNNMIFMAFMTKIEINIKIDNDVTVCSDVIRDDVIARNGCKCGDLKTTRTEEEGAAGLLLALPSCL